MNNKVTVFTTVYNGLPYLREAIESTLNQTYTDFEYLIIDDCSTDKSVKLIESYNDPRIKFIKNDKNLGVAKTINKVLSLIDSKYAIRLDQDDVSLPHRFDQQISYLEENPNIDIVCSWEHCIDQNGNNIRDWKAKIRNYGEFLGPVLLGLCPIWHPSIAFKKDSMINVGGFNADYTRAEDFEVTVRMALKRLNATIIPKFHLLQREHDNRQSIQYENIQIMMNKKIHNDAIKYFINGSLIDDFGSYLRLEQKSIYSKHDLINYNNILHKLFDAVKKKQKLTIEEMKSMKRIFIKRIGLGLFYCNKFVFLPNSIFQTFYYLLSPFSNLKIRKFLSRIYYLLKR